MTEKCNCYAMLNPEKAPKELLEIYPDRRVPIRFPIPAGTMQHPKLTTPKRFYWVAIDRLTGEQRQRTVDFITKKFDLDVEDVQQNLEKEGLPLREEIIEMASWCALHVRCAL